MQQLFAERDPTFDPKAWKKKRALPSHAERVLQSGVQVFDAKTKDHVLTFMAVPDAYPASVLESALRKLRFATSYRTDGLQSHSCTFGYQPRIPLRRDYCSVADSAISTPVEHKVLIDYGRTSAMLYSRHLPELFRAQHDTVVASVGECWRENGVHFTSGIANDKNVLAYHCDAGNFPDTLSTMYTLTRDMGEKSGMLVIPEYKIALSFTGFELLIFNGARYMHGVTPIKSLNKNSMRYSVVYYALKSMAKCGTPEEELQRIREVKTARASRRTEASKGLLLEELGEGRTQEELQELGKRHVQSFQRVKRKVPK